MRTGPSTLRRIGLTLAVACPGAGCESSNAPAVSASDAATVVQVAAAGDASCVLHDDGAIVCWGLLHPRGDAPPHSPAGIDAPAAAEIAGTAVGWLLRARLYSVAPSNSRCCTTGPVRSSMAPLHVRIRRDPVPPSSVIRYSTQMPRVSRPVGPSPAS